jgi:hypothetical protein
MAVQKRIWGWPERLAPHRETKAIESSLRSRKSIRKPRLNADRLGRDMWWYVYLITIPAVAFLSQIAVELIGRPIRTVLSLRHQSLERMLAFRDLSLPRPREAAVSSRQIREHDQAVRNVREAQRTLDDLGTKLLAFSESEPTVCGLMALCGLDIVSAGYELIHLSRVYATAKIDSDELRHSIETAHHAIGRALAVSRRPSSDDLIKIRLEPMYLRGSRHRQRPLGRPRVVSRRVPLRARLASGPTTRFAS